MDSALFAATTAPFIRAFMAVRIELRTGQTINLVDGTGFAQFPVNGVLTTFTGADPTFGTLASANSIAERVADEAPRFSFSMMPPSLNALGTLNDPRQQDSPVTVWWGLYNDQIGAVIGAPELLWNGRFDFVKSNFSETAQTIEINTVSAFDRLFTAEEGQRLNGEWHRSIWPGETGLDYVYDAGSEVYWGQEAPAKTAVVYTGGAFAGGYGMINRNLAQN